MDKTLTICTFNNLCCSAVQHLMSQAEPMGCGYDDRSVRTRVVCEHFCKRAVRYLHRHGQKTDAALQRMKQKFLPHVHDELCGFIIGGALILESFISWCLCKLLDWLWGTWWVRDHNSQDAVAVMVMSAGAQLPGEENE